MNNKNYNPFHQFIQYYVIDSCFASPWGATLCMTKSVSIRVSEILTQFNVMILKLPEICILEYQIGYFPRISLNMKHFYRNTFTKASE